MYAATVNQIIVANNARERVYNRGDRAVIADLLKGLVHG